MVGKYFFMFFSNASKANKNVNKFIFFFHIQEIDLYLSIIFHLGFFGFFSYLFLQIFLLLKCMNNLRTHNLQYIKDINLILLPMLVIYIFAGLFDTIYATASSVLLFGLLFSLISLNSAKTE